MSDHCLVLSTVASAEDGERLARALVEKRVAACVNVLPGVTSFYRFKGNVQREEERLLLIKTRADLFEELRRTLVELHPYEVPEVIAVPITAGHGPYFSWLDDCVSR